MVRQSESDAEVTKSLPTPSLPPPPPSLPPTPHQDGDATYFPSHPYTFTTLFGYLLPAGFIFIPAIDYVCATWSVRGEWSASRE